jgi:hypothetical protein
MSGKNGKADNKEKLKVVKGKTAAKTSRNPLIRSPIQPDLHPPEPKPEPKKVRRLRIVPDDDPDDAA